MGATGVVSLAGCIGGGSDQDQEPIELVWANWLPESHSHVQAGIVAFADRVEELTSGQVTFDLKHGGSVGDAGQMLDLVKSKAVDVAFTVPAYYNDKLQMSDVVALPRQYDSGVVGTKAYQKIALGVLLEEEYKSEGIYPILPYALNPFQLITKSKKIDSLDDFNGQVLRVSGGLKSLTVQELGAEPAEVSGSEFFTALQRGTVDGGVFPVASIGSYDLQKQLNYISTNANLSGNEVINFMNLDRWKSLPDHVKDAFTQAREEVSVSVMESRTESLESDLDEYKDMGIEVYSISEEETQRWEEQLSSVESHWVDQLENDGLPANRVLTEWKQALESVDR